MKANKIEIENFRKFRGNQIFSLNDINILVGPNNSGKSAVIKALLLLKENMATGWQELRFGGETTHRILSFQHAAHQFDTANFKISFDVDSLCQTSYWDGVKQVEDKLGHAAELTYREGPKLGTAILDNVIISDQDQKTITSQANRFRELFTNPGYFPVRDWISALKYTPPYRSIGLKEYKNATFRHFGKWLDRNHREKAFDDRQWLVKKWCSQYGIGEIEVEKTEDGFVVNVSRNGKQIDLSILGSGSAQILGVILLIAASTQESIILEEPESNLHPDFQSQLADLIVDGIGKDYGNQFIVETHSEYLIRRFQYLVAKKKVDPEKIKIFYFNTIAGETGSFKTLTIGADGNLSGEFGEGFFDHAPFLITELWKAQRN